MSEPRDSTSAAIELQWKLDRQDFFPDRGRHWHQSDAILRDAKSEVRYIGEVENHPVRRDLVRASILADYLIGEFKQQTRSRLILVVYTEYGIGPIRNFIEKLHIAKRHCRHLGDLEIRRGEVQSITGARRP